MCTRAYQVGVDKLEFRSEKRFSGGMVVMEIRFDRAAPRDDRFEIKVVDTRGKVVRQERYEREQIEKTDKELFVEVKELRKQKEQGNASAEQLKKLASIEARLATVEKVMPASKKDEEKPKEKRKK